MNPPKTVLASITDLERMIHSAVEPLKERIDAMKREQEYLSLTDAGKKCGVSVATVRRWTEGGLPVCKVGNVVRVKSGDLTEWMEGGR